MSEPSGQARTLRAIAPDLFRWHVRDERIGGTESDAYAIVRDGAVTLIDPLPIDEVKLRHLGNVEAIVLTAGNHQRSAWRFRKLFGAKVWAPKNALGLEEQPDQTYSGGDLLPGGLIAVHTPGPVESMHSLWLEKPGNVVFLSDILIHDGSGNPAFVPGEYQDDPKRTRASVRRILQDIPTEAIAFAHGPPIMHGARMALEAALTHDHEALT
jgi:glyoxylase-like metal-dependent hydrolase (beta-lactamase superfamily II)